MPRKPFDFMIVCLNKDYANSFKRDDVCIVTPYNWYGNTNGWDKNDPEAAIFEREEQEHYKLHPHLMSSDRVYWKQERGYTLHSKKSDTSIIVAWNDNRWDILNIDGEDHHSEDYPLIALEVLKKYLK